MTRGTIGAVALLTVFVGTGCAESFFYRPWRETFETPPRAEDVWFRSADGTRLHGWFFAGARADRGPAILHTHGNKGNLAYQIRAARFLTERGFHVLMFDYRGYGRSDPPDGRLDRYDLLDDARAALAYLRTRPEVDTSRIGLYGNSLGSVFALALAAEDESVAAVACVSAFSTWQGVAHDQIPVLGGAVVPPGLDPADSAAALHIPALFVHGDADRLVPFRHQRRLVQAAHRAGVPVFVHVEPGAGHSDIYTPTVRNAVTRFFARYLRRSGPSRAAVSPAAESRTAVSRAAASRAAVSRGASNEDSEGEHEQ